MTKLMHLMTKTTWEPSKPLRAQVAPVAPTKAEPESRRERIKRLAREISARDAEALAILAK